MIVDYNKATKLLAQKKYDKAIRLFKRELTQCEFKECYLNLGNAYRQLGRLDLATSCYKQAADTCMPFANSQCGPYAMALNNLGLVEYTKGFDDQAIEYYKQSLAVDPQLVDTLWNYASASLRKLCSGEPVDAAEAWKLYSYRFVRENPTHLDRSIPQWDGVSKVNKLVVLTEQGFGDKLQFGRYLHLLREYCNHLVVQCPPEMLELHEPEFETCGLNLQATGADRSVPLCSLAQKFGIDAGKVDWFRHKVAAHKFSDTGPNIIVEWQGSQTHSNDHNRSCNPGYFSPLQEFGNLHNIRPGALGPKFVRLWNSESWMRSAELVLGADLVITIDTSLVHLAGSLGVPTLLLQPKLETDFRWGSDKLGHHNVWYPSVKVIRNPNSWELVFKEVKQLLQNGQAFQARL